MYLYFNNALYITVCLILYVMGIVIINKILILKIIAIKVCYYLKTFLHNTIHNIFLNGRGQ